MATQGQEWQYDKTKILEALKESKGRITVACKLLKVQYETLKKVLDKEPDLDLALKNLREDFENTILDMAENTVMRSMEKVENDPAIALKAAMYTLNSKGKSRNWDNTMNSKNQASNGVTLEQFKEFCEFQEFRKASQSVSGDEKSSGSDVENKQPILN